MGQLRTLETKWQVWHWGPLENKGIYSHPFIHHLRILSVCTKHLLRAQPCGYRDEQIPIPAHKKLSDSWCEYAIDEGKSKA